MFEFNARTEMINGAYFIEKDVIMFDYDYTGEILFQVDAKLKSSGFGFIIAEEDNEGIEKSASMYMIKFNSDNSYNVIYKSGLEQTTVASQFINNATTLYEDEDVIFFFRKQGDKLIVNKAIRQETGIYVEIEIARYKMPYDFEKYKIGIYSNGGNTVKFASISTEAPTNWISNVFNANGGRIKWIRDGFILEEAEYDIEVEAQNIELPAGTYYFDYETDNPNIRAYIYKSYRKNTGMKRDWQEIVDTSVDEEKNILENGEFTLDEDHAINIKFEGRNGTVKNICIKVYREAEFVETDYHSTRREPSRLIFDLRKIKKIRLRGKVTSIPVIDASEHYTYYLFNRNENILTLTPEIQMNQEYIYEYDADTGELKLNSVPYTNLGTEGNTLYAFYNVSAQIYELVVTTTTGTEINVILQKTFKITVDGTIESPIIVIDAENEPLDLSSSFRFPVETTKKYEIFYAWNPIKLNKYVNIVEPNIHIYGIRKNIPINVNGTTLDEISEEHIEILYNPTQKDIMSHSLAVPSDMKNSYKWIIVEYNALDKLKCVFTNWEREVYDLEEDSKIYLTKKPIDANGNITVYGIKNKEDINMQLLYYIPSVNAENSIDLCAYDYDILTSEQFKTTGLGKVVLDNTINNKYKYIVIDYLKADSYALNHRGDYWEIDVSSANTDFSVKYDAEEGIIQNTFKAIPVSTLKDEDTIQENDFIVLGAS